MPPRPFPFSYRLGNDICSIGRIHDLINPKTVDASSPAGTPLKRFVSKLLTWPEQQYFYKRFQMVEEGLKDFQPRRNIPQLKTASQYLAGRWAAKEAVRKACEHLGSSNGFHSIIILPVSMSPKQPLGATSRPQALVLRDRLPDLPPRHTDEAMPCVHFDIDSLDGQMCEVSISHDTTYATAVALVPVVEEWQSLAEKPQGQDHKG